MKNWFKVFCLFFVFGLLIYFNALNNKFLIDDYVFLNNPTLSAAKFISSQWSPYREQTLGVLDSHEMFSYYRPATLIVYDFCYAHFKHHYWEYHLLNLFLFVLASSLVFLLVEKVCGNYMLALLAGLFYLIHPINGIIVDYISAGVFAFQVIFMLGTLLLLLASLERNDHRGLYFLSLLFSFLSLFWHESGIMTPFYIGAVVLFFRKDPFKKKVFYLFPYFLIVFSYLVFRSLFLGIHEPFLQHTILHMTGGEYLASLFRILVWYISQLFCPNAVVMQWGVPILHHHLLGYDLGGMLLIIFFLLFIGFSKEKLCQFWFTWLLIGFIPVCLGGFRRPDVGVIIEPHWFVFSSIGFFMLVAYGCTLLLARAPKSGWVALFILIFVWGSVAHANNRLWFDQRTYALYWSGQVPGFKPSYLYLAEAYQKEGVVKEAKKYYGMAISGYGSDVDIYNNLGVIAAQGRDWKEAELNFRKVLEFNPLAATAYNNLGIIYSQQGQWAKSKEYFSRALVVNPLLIDARTNLALILFKRSEYQKAIHLCFKNLEMVNGDPKTLFLLVNIFIQEKDFNNVKKYAYQLINSPADAATLTKLGVAMGQNNLPVIAWDAFEKAIRVDPDYKDTYLNAGKLLVKMGKYDEAVKIWKMAGINSPAP